MATEKKESDDLLTYFPINKSLSNFYHVCPENYLLYGPPLTQRKL
ncbi:hypothetical protein [Candidatus Phytoplasma citri]|nr:hypothetical protein [Candidatus Phytoplasma aurantifolia]